MQILYRSCCGLAPTPDFHSRTGARASAEGFTAMQLLRTARDSGTRCRALMTVYSYRRALMGSTFIALHAGKAFARSATPTSSKEAVTKTIGSAAPTP